MLQVVLQDFCTLHCWDRWVPLQMVVPRLLWEPQLVKEVEWLQLLLSLQLLILQDLDRGDWWQKSNISWNRPEHKFILEEISLDVFNVYLRITVMEFESRVRLKVLFCSFTASLRTSTTSSAGGISLGDAVLLNWSSTSASTFPICGLALQEHSS